MTISYQLELRTPIERAFDLVDDDKKIKRWMKGFEETVYILPYDRKNPVGTKIKQKIREAGRIVEYDGEITAYEKPRHLGVRIGNGRFAMQVDYRFTGIEGGTRLEFTSRTVQATPTARFLQHIFGRFSQSIVARQMRRLKLLAEREH